MATGMWTAAFEQHDVMPDIVHVAVSFAKADFPESTGEVQRTAGVVGGDDLRLQGPVPI